MLIFTTPMELYDRDFLGQYLRMIRRVQTSLIALIPPTQGIPGDPWQHRAISYRYWPNYFPTILIRCDPECVALTSPLNSTGMFELEFPEPDMLGPGGTGVDSTWEFRIPEAVNELKSPLYHHQCRHVLQRLCQRLIFGLSDRKGLSTLENFEGECDQPLQDVEGKGDNLQDISDAFAHISHWGVRAASRLHTPASRFIDLLWVDTFVISRTCIHS